MRGFFFLRVLIEVTKAEALKWLADRKRVWLTNNLHENVSVKSSEEYGLGTMMHHFRHSRFLEGSAMLASYRLTESCLVIYREPGWKIAKKENNG